MSTDSPSNNYDSSHPEQGEQGDSDKLLELCPSCSRHDSWSSCVCSRLEQAYELGRQSKLSSPPPEGQDESRLKTISLLQSQLAQRDKEIEKLNKVLNSSLETSEKAIEQLGEREKEIDYWKQEEMNRQSACCNKDIKIEQLQKEIEGLKALNKEGWTKVEYYEKQRDYYKALAEANERADDIMNNQMKAMEKEIKGLEFMIEQQNITINELLKNSETKTPDK